MKTGEPSKLFDPRLGLATSIAAQPGVYAVLLGSGVSTGVGVPTGWGVVEALVRQAAAAAGNTLAEGFDGDWQAWWKASTSAPLGYSNVLETLASTPAARRALLARFFEATEAEREDGLKVPGAAHKALAKLVRKGAVKVVLTTNFDRLTEQALDAEGVMYQVVTSDAGALGMEPLQHAGATIIKLHGDYSSLHQRNTIDELKSYSKPIANLLDRVLDEYGLIVSGWSGDWDPALATAIEKSANRRYPLYWTARSSVSETGKNLLSRSGSNLIPSVSAEDFFPDLLDRVEAVEGLAESPASLEVKLRRLKRALPDPIRQLELRDLFEEELDRLQIWARERPRTPTDATWVAVEEEFSAIATRTQPLLELYSTGIALDRDRQHSDLWVWVLQRALRARVVGAGTFVEWWGNLAHYPALLLLRAGAMAALSVGHENVITRIAGEPTWRSIFIAGGEEVPAHEALHLHRVLDNEITGKLPMWDGRAWSYPSSHLTRLHLSPLAERLVGDPDAGDRLLGRMEYRMALASHLIRPDGVYIHGAAAGDFLGSWPYGRGEDDQTYYTTDFLTRGDQEAWGRGVAEDDAFEARILDLDERLKRIRRD